MGASIGDSARQGGSKGLPRSLAGLVEGIDEGAGVSYLLADLNGDQNLNLTAPSHVELNRELQSSDDMVGALSIGTAQQLGIITLPAGKLWECEAGFSLETNAAGAQLCCSIFDLLSVQAEGVGGMLLPMTNLLNQNHSNQCKAFIDTRNRSSVVTIELRILSGVNVTLIYSGSTSHGPTWLKVRSL